VVRFRPVIWQRGLVLLSAALFLGLSAWFSSASGLPFDDSWIHQDFARTLVTSGQFSFQPGTGGAGETSPLWALLLTPPYLLAGRQPPIWLLVAWSDLLGTITLAGTAWTAGVCAHLISDQHGRARAVQEMSAFLAVVAILTEWHLILSAASGMETLLFVWLVLLVLLLTAKRKHPAWIGFLTSVALAIRPESWLLLLIVVAVSFWLAWRQRRLRDWTHFWAAPYIAFFLPGALLYVLFNISVGGSIVPTTYFAKSGEFVGGFQSPIEWGYLLVTGLFLSSPVFILLTGLSLCHRLLWRVRPACQRPLLFWLLLIWAIAILAAFAGRVDPNYQNERYLLPALPPLLILAAVGAAPVLVSFKPHRMMVQLGFAVLVIAAPISVGYGISSYHDEVREVNCTQVATGKWMSAYVPPGVAVATHDIGAIGYFSGHPVVDITGLVDPDLIPLLHNPKGMTRYLYARRVGYAALVQVWYPNLVQVLHGTVVYNACAPLNMRVYKIGS